MVVREALPLAEPPRHRLRAQKPIAVELGHAAPKVRQAEEGLQHPELPRRDLGVPWPRHPEHRPTEPRFQGEGGAPVHPDGHEEEVRHKHVVIVVVCVALVFLVRRPVTLPPHSRTLPPHTGAADVLTW